MRRHVGTILVFLTLSFIGVAIGSCIKEQIIQTEVDRLFKLKRFRESLSDTYQDKHLLQKERLEELRDCQ